jgi:hypothetical protein
MKSNHYYRFLWAVSEKAIIRKRVEIKIASPAALCTENHGSSHQRMPPGEFCSNTLVFFGLMHQMREKQTIDRPSALCRGEPMSTPRLPRGD